MSGVLKKCVDLSAMRFGTENAVQNEQVEVLMWFDEHPKDQAEAGRRGYGSEQVFRVVLEENRLNLCLVLRYLLKFFTHDAAQAAQVK